MTLLFSALLAGQGTSVNWDPQVSPQISSRVMTLDLRWLVKRLVPKTLQHCLAFVFMVVVLRPSPQSEVKHTVGQQGGWQVNEEDAFWSFCLQTTPQIAHWLGTWSQLYATTPTRLFFNSSSWHVMMSWSFVLSG